MAISALVETGIRQKVENDFTALPHLRRHFDEAFWKRSNVQGNKPLTLHHVLPSFMLTGFGLIPSIIIFILELMPCLNKKRGQADRFHNTKPLKEFETTNIPATEVEKAVDMSDTTIIVLD